MGARASTFTSYVNIEPAKGIDAALASLESKTNSTLSRIARQAEKASASTSGARGGPTSAQIQQMATAERARAVSLQQTVTASNAAAAASSRMAAKHMLESNAARAASNSTSALERSLRLASVAANVAQGPLGPLAGRLSAVATAVRELTGIRLGLVGAGALGATFIRAASNAQDLKSKLYPLYESQGQVNAAFADTVRIANAARVNLEPIVDLYQKLTIGGRAAGLSAQQVSQMTETAAKAAKLSGGSTETQGFALYQFSQGIGSNQLGGDELKSIKENSIRLAKAIADGLGVPIGELKKLGKEGKLTAKVVADALEKESARIDAELAKLPPTISSATARLSTAFTSMISGADDAYGATRVLGSGLSFLADNLSFVTMSGMRLLAVYASFRAASTIKDIYASVSAWSAQRAAINEAASAQMQGAQQAVESARVNRTASAERVAALRAERAELQANIVAETEAAAAARAQRNALTAKTTGKNYPGRALDLMALKQASDEAVIAEQRLGVVQDRNRQVALELHSATQSLSASNLAYRNSVMLSNVASGKFTANMQTMRAALGSLRAETGSLIIAKQQLRGAMQNSARSASLFAAAGRGLIGVLGSAGLGLALSVGINLLIQWATREDAAAASADRMAQSQATLGRFIDFTTGKIIQQNAALVALQAQQLATDATKARTQYSEARRAAIEGSQTRTKYLINGAGGAPTPITLGPDPAIQAITSQYGKVNAATIVERLEKLRRSRLDLNRQIDTQVSNFGAAAKLAQESTSAQAGADYLRGNRSKENLRRLQGNFTGRDPEVEKPSFAGGGDPGGADKKLARARKERAAATSEATKAEKDLEKAQSLANKRTDILRGYEDTPSRMKKAAEDTRTLGQMVGKQIALTFDENGKALTKGFYTPEMAAADRARIETGMRQPLRDMFDEQLRGRDIQMMRLGGYDLEANALEKLLSIQDDIGQISQEDLERQIRFERQQLRINDAMESRQRQVQGILDAANQTRDAFENMLVGLRHNPVDAVKQFGNTIIDNIMRVQARQLTEKLFAGADEKLRNLVSGSNGVERAAEVLANNVKTTAESVVPLQTGFEKAATAAETFASRATAAAEGMGGGIAGLAKPTGGAAGAVASAIAGSGGTAGLIPAAVASASTISLATRGLNAAMKEIAANDNLSNWKSTPQAANDQAGQQDYNTQITVTGTPRRPPLDTGPKASGTMAFEEAFKTLGENLDKTFKSGKFFTGIGGAVGKALGGAGQGMMASGVLGALGVKQSSTGAAIGGAIGSFIPGLGPFGGMLGGLIGGTLGGLFAKKPSGSVVINSANMPVSATGNKADVISGLNSLGGTVQDQINQIASAFGVDPGKFSVSIGQYKDYYRVSASGSASVGDKRYPDRNRGDILYDGKDESQAIAVALRNAISDGAIQGISEAAQRILNSGQNLQAAISKAVAIEQIPKRLMAKTDPVRYAVQSLNDEFTRLISYLKEGKATAGQFADAQKLYDLERADAIKQATQQSVSALQAYLDEMKGGSSSPFNKATVYENASSKLSTLRADIEAGKVVDQNDLLTAAKNFQDASQKLNGSSQAFFADFDSLFQLLTKARDNVTASTSTSTTALPDSPFNNADMTSYLATLNQTTSTQTDVLAGRLDAILEALRTNGTGAPPPANDALALLPGLRGGKLFGYG